MNLLFRIEAAKKSLQIGIQSVLCSSSAATILLPTNWVNGTTTIERNFYRVCASGEGFNLKGPYNEIKKWTNVAAYSDIGRNNL